MVGVKVKECLAYNPGVGESFPYKKAQTLNQEHIPWSRCETQNLWHYTTLHEYFAKLLK